MRKLVLPLAMAAAICAFGSIAKAGISTDDFDDDATADDIFQDGSPAVPEPSAALAMGAGLATVAFALRRRR
jgi:hypothetical protein